MSDVMLECRNVSIRYMVGDFKNIGLKEWFARRLTGKYKVKEFWADRHISFTLNRGDMLGIIGTNGAGKSTILKAISGIMEPTEGRVFRKGKVSALLELASGFDGDLNVKENAYLRGAMLGYTRKFMDETYERIVDFAELKEFEDRPFKQLSSGMKSRLAFSIASLVKPEILILDEVLSVGDGAFRAKSEAKMREIIKGGATTIFVSHSLLQIRQMCNKVLWLEKGHQVAFTDDVKGVCDFYESYLKKKIVLPHIGPDGGKLKILRSPADKVRELQALIHASLAPYVTGNYHLIAAPHIRNVGDHLIFQGEVDFLKQFNYACKSIHSIQTFAFPKMAKDEVIFIHGGGFIGDAWGGGTLRVLNRVISRYPDNSIVIFPQSTCFKSKEFLAETRAVWAKHKHLTVCTRDKVSFDFIRANFPRNTVLLVPDMAFYADVKRWMSPTSVVEDKRLLFMRWDCEAKDKLALAKLQQNLRCDARDWPTISGSNADFLEIRRLTREKKYDEADRYFLEKLHPNCMRDGIRFLEPYRNIYTTRLHGLILSMLLNKPSITFFDNSYGKIGALYETWLADVEGIAEASKDVRTLRVVQVKPDVTVIIAAHQRPDTLRVALDSVYAQEKVKVEVIVVNGIGEPDPVDDVAHEYPSCIYIKDSSYLTLSAKHELGLKLASADLVHFLDDDDYLTDSLFFRKAVDVMKGNPKLVFVSGSCDRRIEESDHDMYRMVANPNQVEGLIEGAELFQGLQITIRKPISTATVFRKTALTSGEPLFEVSDSSLFLKALLDGPAYIIPDKVAVYRVWPEQMTRGRGSDYDFKLNVVRQKEALYRQAIGKIADPLAWWSKTFQMNVNYFEKSFKSSDERRMLAEWGLAHAHGSADMIAFCKRRMNANDAEGEAMLLNGWLEFDDAGGVKPRNWGDDINLPLLEALTDRKWELLSAGTASNKEDLLFIGSTMNLVRSTTVVWGAGVKRADFKLPAKPARVCSVRGPRTRQCLLNQGIYCPEVYGDPALLLPYVYRPSLKKRYRITVIPHYRDYDLPHVAAFRAAHPEVNFIDMRHYGDWRSVVDRIVASELVVSSSLHGLIAADAYGVPNVWAEFSDAMRGEILKYYDYAEGVGRDLNAPLNFRSSFDLAAAERLASAWRPIHFDCSKFLAASPLAHPLRVLFVVKPGVGTITRNTFTETLGAALVKAGCRVEYGRDRFWQTKPGVYDVVHLQWPEILIGGRAEAATEATLARIRGRLAELKRAGTKIVYTRHNRAPHRIAGEEVEKLTEICETRVNAIVHMGEVSRCECVEKHLEATSVVQAVIPHHLKDEIDFSLSREAARKKLGIAADEQVLLAFGAFRHDEEVTLLRQAVDGLDVPRFRLLAPQCPGEGFVGVVPDEDLPMYFAAADVVFLQRVKVLNSGILPLAFDAARVCVGPADGNVGEILLQTGNPVFDPTDRASVQAAIRQGFALSAEGKGAENRAFARARWNPQDTAKKTMELYRDLVGVSILRKRALRVFFADIGNMGDQLNRLVLDRIFGYEVEAVSPGKAEMFGIGSHLSLLAKIDPARKPPVAVWGTGFISKLSTTARIPKTGFDCRAVRGELSRRIMEKKLGRPLDVPTGDPGLLASLLFAEPVPKAHRLGVIPHFRERGDPRFQELACLSDDSVIIDLTGDPLAVIREIASCEQVISSSLHGLIVADSFGIPNLHVKVTDRVSGDGFKFADYYSAFRREPQSFDLNERKLTSLSIIGDRGNIMQEEVVKKRLQLLSAFPA